MTSSALMRAYQASSGLICGDLAQPLAIAAGAGYRRVATRRVRQAVGPGREHERGDQPLDVPFPGRRQGLVEVVDVEDDVALGRGEAAEIQQVAVAAGLDMNARRRRGGEVGGHDARRAAVEGERRLQHPAVADRDEFGHAVRHRRHEESRAGRRDPWAASTRPGWSAEPYRAAACRPRRDRPPARNALDAWFRGLRSAWAASLRWSWLFPWAWLTSPTASNSTSLPARHRNGFALDQRRLGGCQQRLL